MKLGNLAGRAVLIAGDRAADVADASAGRFGPSPREVLDRWDEFVAWAAARVDPQDGAPFREEELLAPVPDPRQIFAIGLNYRAHADESGFELPEHPPVFTKFLSSITGPIGEVRLPDGGSTDWEVELVAVIGRECFDVAEEDAWSAVAGLTVGQDLSERTAQLAGPVPQFSLAKSHPGFGPIGPWLVTVEEFTAPDDLALGCSVNGETVQSGRTRDLVFSVPALVSRLSRIVRLYPGDLVFTGTPSGVGMGRTPPRYLRPGDELESWIDGIGRLRQRFTG